MAVNMMLRSSSTAQFQQYDNTRTQHTEPNWLSRLLSRRSRSKQEHNDQKLDKPRPWTVEDAFSKPKPAKSKRRFSFAPRKDEKATRPEISAAQMSNKEATASTVPSSASAAYIPTHAGSDFGKVAIPTTYRNSLVFLYSGKASDKYQYRRHPQYYNDKGQSASHNAPANAATTTATSSPSRVAALGPAANFERLRLSVVNNFYAGDSSENLTDAVPMTPLSPAPLGNRRSSAPLIQSRSPESHRLLRKSRSSLAVTTVTCSDADDEKDDDFVDFDSSDEENSRTTKEQRRKLAKVPKKKNKRDTSTSQRRHSTPGHSPQTSVTELIVSPSTVSLSSVTARPQPLGDSCKKDGKDRLNSKMASLGVKVSEYIKPTTMPDNRLPTMQNIWVGRVD